MFFLLFCAASIGIAAQEPATIRIKKESDLQKAVFDNTEYRLFAVDRFGNPQENEILQYVLTVKTARDARNFQGYGNKLSPDMVKYLRQQKTAAKIFFTSISAKDDNGHAVKLPDIIDTWFPDCRNCGETGKHRRR